MSAMTYEDARSAIYSRLNTAWSVQYPSVPVNYENRNNVDLATQQTPFISCEVIFTTGEQVSIEITPVVRTQGVIYVAAYIKDFDGVAVPNAHLQYLKTLFETKSFGGVNTRAAQPMPGDSFKAWYRKALRIPFWFDAIP